MATQIKGKPGRIKAQIEALEKLRDRRVEAGWFESDRYPSGESVASVMRLQEFGGSIQEQYFVAVIPARPFMRLASSNFSDKRLEIEKRVFGRYVSGKINPEQALAQIGQAMESEIVYSIKNGAWTPNAPYTIKKKGFDKPLIDSGHAWQSVSSKVF